MDIDTAVQLFICMRPCKYSIATATAMPTCNNSGLTRQLQPLSQPNSGSAVHARSCPHDSDRSAPCCWVMGRSHWLAHAGPSCKIHLLAQARQQWSPPGFLHRLLLPTPHNVQDPPSPAQWVHRTPNQMLRTAAQVCCGAQAGQWLKAPPKHQRGCLAWGCMPVTLATSSRTWGICVAPPTSTTCVTRLAAGANLSLVCKAPSAQAASSDLTLTKSGLQRSMLRQISKYASSLYHYVLSIDIQ